MAIRLGSERLLGDQRRPVAGKRVGLVTNQTGVDASLRPTAEIPTAAGASVIMAPGLERAAAGRAG